MQGNYGYANNPMQGSYTYVNNPSQGNYGNVNVPMQGGSGPVNNSRPINNTAAAKIRLADNGPGPFVVGIDEAAKQNSNFRIALWTGEHLQLILMSINPGEDIGFESHPDLDQFMHIEEGSGILVMGSQKDNLDFQKNVSAHDSLIIPAGKWHNLVNSGRKPLKLYSICTHPQHPFGTAHATKAEAKPAEDSN
jgi:mannose-6-phosphate isomerase-like protein (cupin superfamily)